MPEEIIIAGLGNTDPPNRDEQINAALKALCLHSDTLNANAIADRTAGAERKNLEEFLLTIHNITQRLQAQQIEFNAYQYKYLAAYVREITGDTLSFSNLTNFSTQSRSSIFLTTVLFTCLVAASSLAGSGSIPLNLPFDLPTDFSTLSFTSNLRLEGCEGILKLLLAIDQLRNGETLLGTTNLFSFSQLTTGTTLGLISHFAPSVLSFGSTATAGLLAFPCALAMFISCGTECYEVQKSKARVAQLENDLDALQKAQNSSPEEIKKLKEFIILEKANGANHKKNAITYFSAGMILTAIGVVAILAGLGVATGGVAPAVLAAVAVAVAIARIYATHYKDYVKEARMGFLTQRLDTLIAKNNKWLVQQNADGQLPTKLHTVTYLKTMIKKNLKKAESIIRALEDNKTDDLKAALNQHRGLLSHFFRLQTTGSKIFNVTAKEREEARAATAQQVVPAIEERRQEGEAVASPTQPHPTATSTV